MKKIYLGALFATLLAFAPVANAGRLLFGTDESIQFIANTTVQTPSGRLYLGHRVQMHAFLLPYRVESKGLVFGISGDPKKYIPLPPAEELATLQAAGFLPKELPRPRLTALDYLFGYSLELFILGSFLYWLVRRKPARR